MIGLPFIVAIARPNQNFIGISIVIFLSLVMLAIVRQQNNTISVAVNSFFNLRFFRQSMREETTSSIRLSRVLLINSFLNIATTLNYFLGAFLLLESEILRVALLFVFVFAWYVVNILIKKIISILSNTTHIETEDRRYNQFFYQSLGLFLLPGIVGLYFFPQFIFGFNVSNVVEMYIKGIVLFLVLNKLVQSILQSFEIKISRFYIFLYICTLEILPLSVGFQLIIS